MNRAPQFACRYKSFSCLPAGSCCRCRSFDSRKSASAREGEKESHRGGGRETERDKRERDKGIHEMSDLTIEIHAYSGTSQVEVHSSHFTHWSKMSFLPSRADPPRYPCQTGPELHSTGLVEGSPGRGGQEPMEPGPCLVRV